MKDQDAHGRRSEPTSTDIVLMTIDGLLFVGQVVLCIRYFNYLKLNWLLYLALAVFALAMFLGWRARLAFEARGESAEGESWLHTRKVVTTDVYAVVRHPMYLSFQLVSLTLVLLCQHWLCAVLGAIFAGLIYYDMWREEQACIERFGEDYRNYMERVPRMNVVAGILRLLGRRSGNDDGD